MLARLTGAPLYIVHMSAKQAVEHRRRGARPGRNVFGETCPQYLYLSLEEQLGAPGFEGAKWVCSTPLRSEPRATRRAVAATCGPTTCRWCRTDHCPFCIKEQKESNTSLTK